MRINNLEDCFDPVAAAITDLTPAYVNPLTLCKTGVFRLEK
jgi:hypothetical protein